MARHHSNYLVNQLIRNKLSGAELDEFLAGLHNQDDLQAYSDALETYFNELVNEPDHPPEPGKNKELPVTEAKTST